MGAIPVPSYPPNPYKLKQSIAKLDLVIVDSSATFCLVSSTILRFLRLGGAKIRIPFLSSDDFSVFKAPENTESYEKMWLDRISLDDLLFLQYTSGSTGNPKGVMIRHSHMYHQCKYLCITVGFSVGETYVVCTVQSKCTMRCICDVKVLSINQIMCRTGFQPITTTA